MANPFLELDPQLWAEHLSPDASPDLLGEAILPYLDLDSDEELLALLALEQPARKRLFEFFVAGTGGEGSEELPPKLVLCEETYEASGRYSAAIAFYALGHDEVLSAPGETDCFLACLFRFKLGHCWVMANEYDKERIHTGAEFALSTGRLLDRCRPLFKSQKEGLRALRYELQSWLGDRLGEVGRFREAVGAYTAALIQAGTTDERVAASAQAASARGKAGDEQTALELLLLDEHELEEVEDPEVLELWHSTKADLVFRLGGSTEVPANGYPSGFLSDMGDIMERMLSGRGGAPGPSELVPNRRFLARALAGTPVDDAVGRHPLLLSSARLASGAGDWDEARAFLEQAAKLEDRLDEAAPRLERLFLEARLSYHQQDLDEALALFRKLRSEGVDKLSDEQRLQMAGEFIHALGARNRREEAEDILLIADEIATLLSRCYWSRPIASARRRQREVAQRPLSAALLALLGISYREGVASDPGQQALATAWRVALSARNPELQGPTGPQESKDDQRTIGPLENRFHSALRQFLIADEGSDWREALEKLQEQELALLRGRRPHPGTETGPPRRGLSVLLFQIGDLVPQQPILLLTHEDGQYAARFLADPGEGLIRSLQSWGSTFPPGGSPHASRSAPEEPTWLFRHSSPTPVGASGEPPPPPPLERILPEDILPSVPRAILHPDGKLTALPWEMLPMDEPAGPPWGSEFPVALGLRSKPPPEAWSLLDLKRGWLGVGDVPKAGPLSHLEGTLEEVESLRELLAAEECPASLLTGLSATFGNLQVCLEELRPAVLHLACHGVGNAEYPDACALILADSPALPQRELLPYRRARSLPLRGVELVVLSACSSLIGPQGWSASIQGLAWAFLEAGVPQVLASRYPVHDQATVTLMQTFYRHLLDHNAAEALALTRHQCLGVLGLDPRHVGAWSVWC